MDVTGSLHLTGDSHSQGTPTVHLAIPAVPSDLRTSQGWHTEWRLLGPAAFPVGPVLTWFVHEASQLHLNIPLLLLQVLLLHPGRNDRSDELLPCHAPGLDPSLVMLKPHLCVAHHLGRGW